jgi:hypothetical protein
MTGSWKQPEYWRAWWRERVSFEQKAAFVVLCVGGLLVAGWLGADSLSSASAGVQRTTAPTIETVRRVVTVREAGKAVTTRVPEVKRIFVTRKEQSPAVTVVRTETAYGTNTVTVPSYVTHVVTAPGRTVTQTQVVTTVATTVEWHVITVVEKSKPVTVTVTAPSP